MSLSDKKLPKLREAILELVDDFGSHFEHKEQFVPGKTSIPASGKVIGASELSNMVDAVLDGWLTTGRYNDAFEDALSNFIGTNNLITVNSGSSANLIALQALTSIKLGERRLKPGDEVICVAAAFPTTVNPIIQAGAIPVFVDIDLETLNIRTQDLELARSEKTIAVMLAHTLGNPFNINEVKNFCDANSYWLIEDCCDALGSRYLDKHVGTFGDLATLSFYPAHQITMGEGGAVFTDNDVLIEIVESLRDWGRDCYCPPGKENTCGQRYCQKHGALPYGYDHKYTYGNLGYNLKITDMQAACGLAQLNKLQNFVQARKDNYNYFLGQLSTLSEQLKFMQKTDDSDPCWFGFPITLTKNANVERLHLLEFLEQSRVGTRLLFAGNLTRQPYFENVRYRVPASLDNTDYVMNNTFWIGVYPGIDTVKMDYMCRKLKEFFGYF